MWQEEVPTGTPYPHSTKCSPLDCLKHFTVHSMAVYQNTFLTSLGTKKATRKTGHKAERAERAGAVGEKGVPMVGGDILWRLWNTSNYAAATNWVQFTVLSTSVFLPATDLVCAWALRE